MATLSETFSNIADAIRGRTGGAATMTPAEMTAEIAKLSDTSSDTVSAETLAEGVTAHDKAGNAIVGTMTAGGGSSDTWFEVINNNMSPLIISGKNLEPGDAVRIIGEPYLYNNELHIVALYTGGGFPILQALAYVNGTECTCTTNNRSSTTPAVYDFIVDMSTVELTGQDIIEIGG